MKNYLMLFISSVSIDTRTLKPRESAYRIFGNDENVMTTQTNESAFLELVMREGGVEKIFVFASYDVRQKYIGYWNDDACPPAPPSWDLSLVKIHDAWFQDLMKLRL